MGDTMYVAVSWASSSDPITQVLDGNFDTFDYISGEYVNGMSVAFYEVPSEVGGMVTVTVSLVSAAYGTCYVGQLTAGSALGAVGAGNSVGPGNSLSLSNPATNGPSFLLALVGATRPSGAFTMSAPAGNWLVGPQEGTGYNPGTETAIYGYDAGGAGKVTFSFTTGNTVSISGIVVEFYLQSPATAMCNGATTNPPTCTGSQGTTNGKGSFCTIPSFTETMGDFMYFAVNYLASSPLVSSVTDSWGEYFTLIGSVSTTYQTVAFYDLWSESGAKVSVTASFSSSVYGTCWAGQLAAGTTVGSYNTGSVASSTSLVVSDTPTIAPSLVLGLFGTDRPSGAIGLSSPQGFWTIGAQQGTGWNPGTEAAMYAYGAASTNPVSFSFVTGAPVSISGIVVDFYFTGSQVEFAPFASNSFASNTVGSGNVFYTAPVEYPASGYMYIDQASTGGSQSSQYSVLEIVGQPLYIQKPATVQFTFYLHDSWTAGFWINSCSWDGSVSAWWSAAWDVGLVGYGQYNQEDQLFGNYVTGPCGLASPRAGSGFSPSAGLSPADQKNPVVVVTVPLSPGPYTPFVDFIVYTGADGSSASITAQVDFGDNGSFAQWGSVVVAYTW